MITLSSIIDQFEADFLNTFQGQVLPSQIKALQAMKICRTSHSPVMQVSCTACDHQTFGPILAVIATVHIVNITSLSNGSNGKYKNKYPPSIL